ncbi:MAG: hypothetical protein ACLFSK_09455 [Ectothiorhodospira sp.]
MFDWEQELTRIIHRMRTGRATSGEADFMEEFIHEVLHQRPMEELERITGLALRDYEALQDTIGDPRRMAYLEDGLVRMSIHLHPFSPVRPLIGWLLESLRALEEESKVRKLREVAYAC